MTRIFRIVAQWPWLTLLVLLALTAVAVRPLVDLEELRLRPLDVDMSMDGLLPEDAEVRKFYDYARRAFGSNETMVVAVRTDDVFTHDSLDRIARITAEIEKLDGVHHAIAITNAANVRGSEDGIDIRKFVTEIPTDPGQLAWLDPPPAGALAQARAQAAVRSLV